MSTATAPIERTEQPAFRHEALLYAGRDEFLRGTLSFIRDAVAAGEPILVVVSAPKIGLLRAELGEDAERVHFADMAEVGANPARIIPAWREFVGEHSIPGRRLRGIGEPIGPSRSPAELSECHRHEALLNLAFADTPDFWLLCPYDTDALGPDVIHEAQCNHPLVAEHDGRRESAGYRGLEMVAAPFGEPLPDPPANAHELTFGANTLDALRRLLARYAATAGITGPRRDDLLLAVNEVATNSVRHAGGRGTLRVWREDDALICEVRDGGRIDQPLAGREAPGLEQVGGHGLWLANQLCELVQLRSFSTGSVVRVHMRRG